MVSAAVDDAQGMTGLGKVKVDTLNNGSGGIGKVDEDHVAHAGSSLVHQAAGFAKVDVLCVLADLGDLHGGTLIIVEQAVQDGADEHLKSGGGAQAAAGQNGGADLGIEALQSSALLGKDGSNTADDGGSGVLLFLVDGQILQVDGNGGIALGFDADQVGAVQVDVSDGLQIDSSCHNSAMLMVSVVAADFGTAGSRENIMFIHVDIPLFYVRLIAYGEWNAFFTNYHYKAFLEAGQGKTMGT